MAKVTVHEDVNTEVKRKPVANKFVTDSLGRSISLRKLTPMHQARLVSVVGATNSKNEVYMAGFAIPAAMVAEIDGVPFPLPDSMLQLEAVLTELSDEGMEAIGKSLMEDAKSTQDAKVEAAKN